MPPPPETSANAPSASFDVTVEARGRDVALVSMVGELDVATVPQVEEALAGTSTSHALVLDLSRVRFIDSTGLRLCATTCRRAREQDRVVVVVRGSGRVARILELSGLQAALPIVDSLEAALERAQR